MCVSKSVLDFKIVNFYFNYFSKKKMSTVGVATTSSPKFINIYSCMHIQPARISINLYVGIHPLNGMFYYKLYRVERRHTGLNWQKPVKTDSPLLYTHIYIHIYKHMYFHGISQCLWHRPLLDMRSLDAEERTVVFITG